jgi:hypothetical protein
MQTTYGTDGERISLPLLCTLSLRRRMPPRRAEQSQPSQSDCSPFTAVKFTLAAHDSGEARTRIPRPGPVSLRRPRTLQRWRPLQTWRCTAGTESTRSTPGPWVCSPSADGGLSRGRYRRGLLESGNILDRQHLCEHREGARQCHEPHIRRHCRCARARGGCLEARVPEPHGEHRAESHKKRPKASFRAAASMAKGRMSPR